MFRTMKLSDLDQILELSKEHFEAVGMVERGFTFIEPDAKKYLENVALDTDYIPIVHEKQNGDIDGIIVFQVHYSPYNHREKCAVEHLWYVKKGGSEITRSKLFVRLLREALKTLKAFRIDQTRISLPSKLYIGGTVGSFLERNGFEQVENLYMRRS